MRLRLFHAPDGARVAYREAGTGPPLALLHSLLLSHRELEPVVEHLTDRFRVVLPDLPLHGDSEDRPRHPYTLDWLVDVMAEFCRDVCGPRPLVGGHGAGAELLLHATARGKLSPARLVLMPNRLHRAMPRSPLERRWGPAARLGGVPGLDRVAAHAARHLLRPSLGPRLSASGNPATRDLVRHAYADVAGNPNLVRSWARLARRWPRAARRELLDAYATIDAPVLLLWADADEQHPLEAAEEALDLFPRAQLRVLSGTGFLMAYDDPVGVARELKAFCG
ncbi:MAG TPA: alpha/beta hydrolase [Solirubrobacteraceae bacterium]|jgi:pimeloyl-ACP methyl ester carboxylesterase|nr:alpha/beta hydrolase [Solirubrobacteraceae bacterium]